MNTIYCLLCILIVLTVCADNHVRSWSVARFRGCISTQPGSTSGSSFKVLSLDGSSTCFYPSVSIGIECNLLCVVLECFVTSHYC